MPLCTATLPKGCKSYSDLPAAIRCDTRRYVTIRFSVPRTTPAQQPQQPCSVTSPRCSGGPPERSVHPIRSDPPGHLASRPKGWQGSLITDERGSIEPGGAVANVPSSGGPLAVLCSIERKGCGSTPGRGDTQRYAAIRSNAQRYILAYRSCIVYCIDVYRI